MIKKEIHKINNLSMQIHKKCSSTFFSVLVTFGKEKVGLKELNQGGHKPVQWIAVPYELQIMMFR